MADEVQKFSGFSVGKFSMTEVPAPFFHELLPLIDDLAELKVLLFFFWALPQKASSFPYLVREDFVNHAPLMDGLSVIDPLQSPEIILDAALERAIQREALLRIEVTVKEQLQVLYFVNTARGRVAIQQINNGQWQPSIHQPIEILPDRPNIYRLYEENIGALTPHIADELKDAEKDFPAQWIEDAIKIAVENNKRSLRYIRAILERWTREGRGDGELHRRLPEEDGKRYVSGEYADFFKH